VIAGWPSNVRRFEQLEDDGDRLGVRQFGVVQHLGARRLMQDIAGAGEEQAQVVGEEAVVGRMIAGQVVLDHFDEIFVPAAGAVEIAVQALYQ
jgi:hypothetical protein